MTQPATLKITPGRVVALAAAVIIVVAAIILATANTVPGPVDYRVAVHGNGRGSWTTPEGYGTIETETGDGLQTVRGSRVDVTVSSTLPTGATCRISTMDGQTLDEQTAVPESGAKGLAASVSVSCKVPKP